MTLIRAPSHARGYIMNRQVLVFAMFVVIWAACTGLDPMTDEAVIAADVEPAPGGDRADSDAESGGIGIGQPQENQSSTDRANGTNTSSQTAGTCVGDSRFDIGAGVYDITGPAAELGMMGYATLGQKSTGIHMRLRSRAFVFTSPCNGNRLVFVSADLGMIFQVVKQKVITRLQGRYGDLYRDDNVMLSATHTHSGPGGFSHYALYNLTVLGFDQQNLDVIVDGIYESIVRAHENQRSGTVRLARGDLLDASFNRSLIAYEANPAEERDAYDYDTDKEMTLLRLDEDDGTAAGMINWFAVHATNIGNQNRLISGDNKGLASYWFERHHGTDYRVNKSFVAAFANSNEGDVSPNLWGVPDLIHDFERTEIIADAHYQRALSLYEQAGELLQGGIHTRQTYVDFSNLAVAAEFTDGAGPQQTCEAALGVSMASGSTEDGPGLEFIPEGMVYDGVTWPEFTLVPELQNCHHEKVILLPTGPMSPYPWTPEVLPLQIATIGNLALVAVPFEITTMAGRRLRNLVAGELAHIGVDHVVIAGLANAYAGYIATREEYAVQHYEGASTHFGPYSLNALLQETHRVAVSLADGTNVDPGPTPRDLTCCQSTLQTGVLFDDKPLFKQFGDIRTNAASSYARGQTARAVFWGGHPKNHLQTQSTFLEVQRRVGEAWVTVARDEDPETRYIWNRSGIANSKVTIEWDIPSDVATGTYRLRHLGHWKSGWTGAISPYSGKSRSFEVY